MTNRLENDADDLRAWHTNKDAEAFRRLCERHSGLVAAACRRQGSPEVEEAVQAVFLVLARRAGAVSGTALGGWLTLTARRVVSDQQRAIARRRRHEHEAMMELTRQRNASATADSEWSEVRHQLDAALASLSPARREAVVRFYLENKPQSQVASELGCSVDAVKTRVHESLARLRSFFARRGLVLSATALATGLTSEATASDPGLVEVCTRSAINPAAAPGATALAHGIITAMTIKTATLTAAGLLLAAGLVTTAVSADQPEPTPTPVPAAVLTRPVSAFIGLWPDFPTAPATRRPNLDGSKNTNPVAVVQEDSPLATIRDVIPGSPADTLGVLPGDELMSLDGQRPADWEAYVNVLKSTAPGRPLTLVVRRAGATLQLAGAYGSIAEQPHPADAQPWSGTIDTFRDDDPLRGFFLRGTRPYAYWYFRDGTKAPGSSQYAWCYRSHGLGLEKNFGTIMTNGVSGQRLSQLLGQRVRFSAQVKGSALSDWCGLWIRADLPKQGTGAFDNMSGRPLRGTFDWRRAEVVIDLKPDVVGCRYGLLMPGSGTAWISDARLEIVGTDVPTTDMYRKFAPAPPAGICPAQTRWLTWDLENNITKLVIPKPSTPNQPTTAQVFTVEVKGEARVAYEAPAWRTSDGTLVVDARKVPADSVITDGGSWTPDSFEVLPNGQIRSFDPRRETYTPGVVVDQEPVHRPFLTLPEKTPTTGGNF